MIELTLAKGTISVAAHIALEELGIAHHLTWIDFSKGEQTQALYHRINPKGRVPALITEHGILTETSAILNYLTTTHPEAGLAPTDPWQKAKLEEIHLYLASTMHVNHAHKMRGHRWSDDDAARKSMTAKVPETMAESARIIETTYLGSPWVLGAQYTTADIYLYAIARWLEGDGVDIHQTPRLAAHFEAMAARPAVQRVEAMHR